GSSARHGREDRAPGREASGAGHYGDAVVIQRHFFISFKHSFIFISQIQLFRMLYIPNVGFRVAYSKTLFSSIFFIQICDFEGPSLTNES
ncbi:hypothetical protein, partial [Paenibacillus polymyxa]|uniref:hypothetical protein n=1 Tax=Paenibacillus polymyxa TaxID=1406 RepID=UPI001E3240DD